MGLKSLMEGLGTLGGGGGGGGGSPVTKTRFEAAVTLIRNLPKQGSSSPLSLSSQSSHREKGGLCRSVPAVQRAPPAAVRAVQAGDGGPVWADQARLLGRRRPGQVGGMAIARGHGLGPSFPP